MYCNQKMGPEYKDVLRYHQSTQISQELVDWADTILYMDKGNRDRLMEYDGAEEKLLSLGGVIGFNKLEDPNFIPPGEELDLVLARVVRASEEFARLYLESETAKPDDQLEPGTIPPELIPDDPTKPPEVPYDPYK